MNNELRAQIEAALEIANRFTECYSDDSPSRITVTEALAALRAEPVSEPVAWMDDFGNAFPLAANKGAGHWLDDHKRTWKPLYAAPTQSAPLNQKVILRFWDKACIDHSDTGVAVIEVARKVEAAHGISAQPPKGEAV
jgi:hypothetical protein